MRVSDGGDGRQDAAVRAGAPPATASARGQARELGRGTVVVGEFVVLLGFWLLLSGRFSPLFLGMGVVSAVLVTACTHDIVRQSFGPVAGGLRSLPLRAWRFAGFGLWVLVRIPPSGVQIALAVLRPRVKVEPGLVRFRTHLESQVARTLLANTITLIPGTLTVANDDGEFTVHAFMPHFADELVSGELQNRIGRVFLQQPAAPPEVAWEDGAGNVREGAR